MRLYCLQSVSAAAAAKAEVETSVETHVTSLSRCRGRAHYHNESRRGEGEHYSCEDCRQYKRNLQVYSSRRVTASNTALVTSRNYCSRRRRRRQQPRCTCTCTCHPLKHRFCFERRPTTFPPKDTGIIVFYRRSLSLSRTQSKSLPVAWIQSPQISLNREHRQPPFSSGVTALLLRDSSSVGSAAVALLPPTSLT